MTEQRTITEADLARYEEMIRTHPATLSGVGYKSGIVEILSDLGISVEVPLFAAGFVFCEQKGSDSA